ncbi:MAG: phosphate/phosphite/phosphonate ABC transporter substrate-binding protein [Pseudobdellovibrionaceae bacterium]
MFSRNFKNSARHFFFALSMGFLFTSVGAVSAAANEKALPEKIVIGIGPGGNPEAIRVQALELAELLKKEFDRPFEIFVSNNYEGLVSAMKEGRVDFAFFSSMTYVLAEKEAQAKVLLKKVWNEPFYFSAIIVQKKSKIKTLSQLKGKSIAFVDEKSASGYLYPQVGLQKNGIKNSDFKNIKYSGNHAQSVKMLEAGEVDAAATFSDDKKGNLSAWKKFGTNFKNFKMIWISEPIPTDPFCVRQGFYDIYPKFTHSLMFFLIDTFEKHKSSKKFEEVLGLKDLMPATSAQYDPVREMVKALGVAPQ